MTRMTTYRGKVSSKLNETIKEEDALIEKNYCRLFPNFLFHRELSKTNLSSQNDLGGKQMEWILFSV